MDKRARQLDQPLEKISARPFPVRQPKLLQDIMRLVKQLTVETLEVTQIVRVQLLSAKLFDHRRDLAAFFAHAKSLTEAPPTKSQTFPARFTFHASH